MCEPVTISATTMWVMAGIAAVAAGAAAYSAKKAGERQAKALSAANQAQADQIADAAGAQMMQRQREARREAGEARVVASESGINLGSNSFLAILQNSMFNEQYDNGLVSINEQNQQANRQAEYGSRMSSISIPTTLGIGLSMVQGGYAGYSGAQAAQQRGSQRGLGGG